MQKTFLRDRAPPGVRIGRIFARSTFSERPGPLLRNERKIAKIGREMNFLSNFEEKKSRKLPTERQTAERRLWTTADFDRISTGRRQICFGHCVAVFSSPAMPFGSDVEADVRYAVRPTRSRGPPKWGSYAPRCKNASAPISRSSFEPNASDSVGR